VDNIKLRLIEAVTRTDGSMARNDPEQLIKVVDTLYDYVIKDRQPKAVEPDSVEDIMDEPKPVRRRSKRR